MKTAVLISNPSEFEELAKQFCHQKPIFIASTYIVQHTLSQNCLEPYLPLDGPSNETLLNSVIYLGHNWFRDSEGNDLLFSKGFSVGPIISRRSMYSFANDYRNYTAIKHWLSCVDTLFISKNETPSMQRVARLFGKQIQFYTTQSNQAPSDTISPELALPFSFPPIHPMSGLARFIQSLFKYQIKKRFFLHLPDWTSDKLIRARRDSLTYGNFLPWKGFYYKLDPKFIREAEEVLPKQLDNTIANEKHIHLVTKEHGIRWDKPILELFAETIQSFYKQYRHFYVRTYAIYKELLSYYQPKVISFPGETHFAYLIGQQIAHNMGVKTILIPDGYQLIKDPSLFYYGRTNQTFLIDLFAAFGRAHLDLLQCCGIPKDQCLLVAPPILSRHKLTPVEKKYDALIMSFAAHLPNPNARWDLTDKFLLDVIKLLVKMGKNRIAIKLKAVTNLKHNIQTILEHEELPGVVNIEFLTGNIITNILPYTECVVGQISTALLETHFYNIPYFVYEPYENGRTDDMIKNSKILCYDNVARTLKQLQFNIFNNRRAVGVDNHYILDGLSISEIPIHQ